MTNVKMRKKFSKWSFKSNCQCCK